MMEIIGWDIEPVKSDDDYDFEKINQIKGEVRYTFKTKMNPLQFEISKILLEWYGFIEKDLEYIINSPSTVNKIFKYYSIAWSECNSICTLFFGDVPIRSWRMGLKESIDDYYGKKISLLSEQSDDNR